MRALASVVLPLVVVASGCASTILSAQTVRGDPSAVYPQIAAALAPQYACTDGTDDVAFTAECKSERGGIGVKVRKNTERPVLALQFWIASDRCGSADFLAQLEQFGLRDASGGTRAYCVEDKLVFAFESYLPARGVEAGELSSFVAAWEKSASLAAERAGLFGAPAGKP